MTFYVGQKVVRIRGISGSCIALADALRHGAQLPVIGRIYTIRAINVWSYGTLLRFCELNNSHLMNVYPSQIEPGFRADCFRPVVERKTDISAFNEILRKATRRIDA